jgi:hypothetical protein
MADFSHPHAGRAVKFSQQPGRADAGPTGRLVLSMSGYPCRGWRDSSKEPSVITDIIACGATFPSAQGISAISGTHIFEVCILESQTSLVLGVFRNLSSSLYYLNANITFRAVLSFTCGLSLIRLGAFRVGFSA